MSSGSQYRAPERVAPPRDMDALRALPVLGTEFFGIRDRGDDAIYAFTDEAGVWQPVMYQGKWHKQKWGGL